LFPSFRSLQTPPTNWQHYLHRNNWKFSYFSSSNLSCPQTFFTSWGPTLYHFNTFPPKKPPGIDLITAEVARQLPKTALIHLTHILNSILRLFYFRIQSKISLVILIPKPGKPADTPSLYRPISLLPFFAKLCEKNYLKNNIQNHQWQSNHPPHAIWIPK